MNALTELKRSVFNTLYGLGLHVSNGLPVNETLPYIQMGDITFSQGATKDSFGGGYELTLHIWCNAYEDIVFHEMIETIKQALIVDGISLPTEFDLGNAKITLLTTIKDQLNNTPINHGVMQIEFSIL